MTFIILLDCKNKIKTNLRDKDNEDQATRPGHFSFLLKLTKDIVVVISFYSTIKLIQLFSIFNIWRVLYV